MHKTTINDDKIMYISGVRINHRHLNINYKLKISFFIKLAELLLPALPGVMLFMERASQAGDYGNVNIFFVNVSYKIKITC